MLCCDFESEIFESELSESELSEPELSEPERVPMSTVLFTA